MCVTYSCVFFFFFNDTATTEIYTLSLHDALPIFHQLLELGEVGLLPAKGLQRGVNTGIDPPLLGLLEEVQEEVNLDRKSTRLNSSHANISYAVFCLKKKKTHKIKLK